MSQSSNRRGNWIETKQETQNGIEDRRQPDVVRFYCSIFLLLTRPCNRQHVKPAAIACIQELLRPHDTPPQRCRDKSRYDGLTSYSTPRPQCTCLKKKKQNKKEALYCNLLTSFRAKYLLGVRAGGREWAGTH